MSLQCRVLAHLHHHVAERISCSALDLRQSKVPVAWYFMSTGDTYSFRLRISSEDRCFQNLLHIHSGYFSTWFTLLCTLQWNARLSLRGRIIIALMAQGSYSNPRCAKNIPVCLANVVRIKVSCTTSPSIRSRSPHLTEHNRSRCQACHHACF